MTKKIKIVATLGPSSNNPSTIFKLCQAGANVFRINFSHGTHEEHLSIIRTIRSVAKKRGFEPAILADLQGPKIRTGTTTDNNAIVLQRGASLTLIPGLPSATALTIGIDYKHLAQEISNGQQIMINDGAVVLIADNIDRIRNKIHCTVMRGGSFSSHKGVNLPNIKLSIPSLTVKDRKDLKFILENDFDFIALSFVRCGQDIRKLRRIIAASKKDMQIIAKIEKPEAVDNIQEILDESAGIMVARGDLGVEATLPKVPLLQKKLIYQAQKQNKLCIVATQMLESMIEHPSPTRAEVGDVAQAILDGADAIMLSGETAVGLFPVNAVETMNEIALTIEPSELCIKPFQHRGVMIGNTSHALCAAAVQASTELSDAPIVCFSLSGKTAFTLSHFHPTAPIYAFSPSIKARRLLSLAHNVSTFPAPRANNMLTLQKYALSYLTKNNIIPVGKSVILVEGIAKVKGATTLISVAVS